MKAPAFQFYAGDYLADAQVMMMTLEQEGAYIRLLAICWREGCLPADVKSLSMLCKSASPAVLRVVIKCFQPNPNQPGTLIHKRLNEEIEKQAQWRAKSAAGGKKSAEKRWADKGGDKGGTNQSITLQSSSSTSTDVDEREPSSASKLVPVLSPERQAALANTDPDEEQHWSAGPLTKPGPFRVICERHPLGKGIAFEHYRLLALAAAEVKNISRTIAQWQSWIFKFLDHQKPVGGSLLTPAALATEAQTGARAPQSPDAIRFDLNPEATARRRREAEENRLHIMALNLERVRRNDELRGLTTTHISA